MDTNEALYEELRAAAASGATGSKVASIIVRAYTAEWETGDIYEALNEGGYEGKVRAVRVNDWTTKWTYADVIEVVEGAGANLDCIMLPAPPLRRACADFSASPAK